MPAEHKKDRDIRGAKNTQQAEDADDKTVFVKDIPRLHP